MAEQTVVSLLAELEAVRQENVRLRAAEAAQEQAALALRESEIRYKYLIEKASDIFYATDAEGHITFINPTVSRILQYSEAELLGRRYLDVIAPERRKAAARFYQRQFLQQTPNTYYEFPVVTGSGAVLWLGQNVQLLMEQGQVAGFQAIARDITAQKQAEAALAQARTQLEARVAERTAELHAINQSLQSEIAERKRLEAQLIQAQKMESIGRMAGGVAHDFNNLLTAILGYTELATIEVEQGSDLYSFLTNIHKASSRAVDLTRQLLAFARGQVIQPKLIDLSELALNLDGILRRLISEEIELTTLPSSDFCCILADPVQIEQVIINLAVNARDAMPLGGKLLIETDNVTFDSEYARRYSDVAPGDYVMVAVSDTGEGMDEETKARIFEPFFTTKPAGKGTGLGLATCYGVVKQAGGHIWVYSEKGRGTTFKVFLPRIVETVAVVRERSARPTTPMGNETILLTEDEEQVREFAAHSLRAVGYTVLEAANGSEALRMVEEYRGDIQLVITDVVMPQMGGRELARRLRAMRPNMTALFMSGYTNGAIMAHGMLDPDLAFLQKPFTPLTLAHKVRTVLDSATDYSVTAQLPDIRQFHISSE